MGDERIGKSGVLRRYTPDIDPGTHIAIPGTSFYLNVNERTLVGVALSDNEVVLRASGLQWTEGSLLCMALLTATVVAGASSARAIVLGSLAATTLLSVTFTALLARQEVRLTSSGMSVRRRTGQTRLMRWSDLEVAVEVRESNGIWLRDVEKPTVAHGVMRTGDGSWASIPGFRSPMWGADKLDDPLTSTDAKVRLVLRYRAWVRSQPEGRE